MQPGHSVNNLFIAATFFATVVVAGILASVYYIVCYLARSYVVGVRTVK